MKKITSFLCAAAISITAFAQTNLLNNSGFESAPADFTVAEGTTNVLMRVGGHYDTQVQLTAPVATAKTVTDGLWVKKAPDAALVKGALNTTDPKEGTTCLNLQNKVNINWYQCVAQQRIAGGLDVNKKYVAKFYAKVDETADNVCTKVVVFITENGSKKNITKTIPLTGGATWTEYTTSEFDLAAYKTTYPTADFTVAYFGIGNPTTTAADGTINYSGVLLDNISFTESTTSGLAQNKFTYKLFTLKNQINVEGVNKGDNVCVYNLLGAKIVETKADDTSISVNVPRQGIYLIQVADQATKVIVK